MREDKQYFNELLNYCKTERQVEAVKHFAEGKTHAQVGKTLGITTRNAYALLARVKQLAAMRGYCPEAGYSAEFAANQYHNRATIQGKIQEGKFVPTQAWLRSKEIIDDDITEIVEGICAGHVKAEKVPKARKYEKAAVSYIVGDHHHGMLAWWREVQQSYDLKISESYFKQAFLDCMANMPNTEVGIIKILGDFFHCENFESQTTKSKHALDTDGRLPKMYYTGAAMLRWAIEQLRRKHKRVVFMYCSGNHDNLLAKTANHSLAWFYEKASDVEITDNTAYFIPYIYGQNFFLVHHGDKTAMAKTYEVALRSFKDYLIKTRWHYGFTGHVHSSKRHDNGMLIESFRILPPQDPYAYDHGYSWGGGEMTARLYDHDLGYRCEHIAKEADFK